MSDAIFNRREMLAATASFAVVAGLAGAAQAQTKRAAMKPVEGHRPERVTHISNRPHPPIGARFLIPGFNLQTSPPRPL